MGGDGPSVLLTSEHVIPVLIEHKILASTVRACGQKLDNIYEFLRQLMNFLTQHMKIFCTTHVNNLYNIYKKYTTHDQLLNNI